MDKTLLVYIQHLTLFISGDLVIASNLTGHLLETTKFLSHAHSMKQTPHTNMLSLRMRGENRPWTTVQVRVKERVFHPKAKMTWTRLSEFLIHSIIPSIPLLKTVTRKQWNWPFVQMLKTFPFPFSWQVTSCSRAIVLSQKQRDVIVPQKWLRGQYNALILTLEVVVCIPSLPNSQCWFLLVMTTNIL